MHIRHPQTKASQAATSAVDPIQALVGKLPLYFTGNTCIEVFLPAPLLSLLLQTIMHSALLAFFYRSTDGPSRGSRSAEKWTAI